MRKKHLPFLAICALVCLLFLAQPVSAVSGWMNECKPYQYTSATEYSPTSEKGFTIGGNTYYEGYVFYCWYDSSLSQALYNLKGEYASFAFDIARVDNTKNAPAKLHVYKDDLFSESIDLDSNALKNHIELDVRGVKSLKLVFDSIGHYYDVYYGVFNGRWTRSGVTAPKIKNDPWIRDCEPYAYSNTVNGGTTFAKTTLLYSSAGQSVTMGGDAYSDAVKFYIWNPARTASASYNLGGDFESFSFTFGHIDNTKRANGMLIIRLDGYMDQILTFTPDSLPRKVTVDLRDVDQMILEFTSPDPGNTYDICYAMAEGKFVSNGDVRAIYLSESKYTMPQCNSTYKLQADVRPRDADNRAVTWTSSDTSVLKVSSSGKLTSVGSGTAQISAVTKDGGYKQICAVTVPNLHSWENIQTVDKPATASSDGSKSVHCILCGSSKPGTAVTIPKIFSSSLSYTKATYTGSKKTPSVRVIDSTGKELVKNTDYTISYGSSSRSNVGRYSVKVKFKGDYSGSKTMYFTIVPQAPDSVTAALYGGYDDVKITWSKCTGASGYCVYYKNVTDDGDYVFLGRTTNRYITTASKDVNLKDGVKYRFKVVPYYYNSSNDTRYLSINYTTDNIYTLKKLPAPTVTTSGTKVKVEWKNISGETGYQISRSSSATGTYSVLKKDTTTGTYATISATKGNTYYYKVRAYKIVTDSDGNDTYLYGPWSAVTEYTR